MKRKIMFATFTRELGSLTCQVFKRDDGMWYLKKRDIFDRELRYNPQKGILEAGFRMYPDSWREYDRFIYNVEFFEKI